MKRIIAIALTITLAACGGRANESAAMAARVKLDTLPTVTIDGVSAFRVEGRDSYYNYAWRYVKDGKKLYSDSERYEATYQRYLYMRQTGGVTQ